MAAKIRILSLLLIILVGTTRAVYSQTPTYEFAIPAGPLSKAISAFEVITKRKVAMPQSGDIEGLVSGGASGVHTADAALAALLVNTGLTFRPDQGGDYALLVEGARWSIRVTEWMTPYRNIESATASKIPTPLRDIPQSLTVVPRALLSDQNAQSIGDAMRNVPGVSVGQGEGNRDQLVLRGMATTSDFFVNGIRDDQERYRDLYNVESIEVLQGPAAVLFGRGGAGGVVNLVTRQPGSEGPSEVALDLGGYGHKRATAHAGMRFGSASTLLVSAVAEDSGSFRDTFYLRRFGINPVAGFQLGAKTTMTVGVERLQDHRLADRGIPSRAGRPVDVAAGQFFGSTSQNESRNDVTSASATVARRFGNGVVIRNSFLVGRYDKYYQNVYAGSAVTPAGTFTLSGYNQRTDRVNAFNQTDVLFDSRLAGITHSLLLGAEVGRQSQDEVRNTAASLSNVPVSESVRDANFNGARVTTLRSANAGILAGYVQDLMTLSPRWKALVGARVDRFRVAVDDRLPGQVDLARSDAALSPRLGLVYQPHSRVTLYTNYGYTFLPSGQTLGLAANTAELEPENARNYELGTRLELPGSRVTLSSAVFRLDRNNVKNIDPADPSRLVRTGQQRTEGIEISAAGSLRPWWKVFATYAYLDARVIRDTSAAPAGRRVGLVPSTQFSAWSTVDLPRSWGAGGGLVRQSRRFTSFSNAVELPGFTRVDALVYYDRGHYRLALNAENVFNAAYYPSAHNDNNISPGAPRNVNVVLKASF